MTAAAASWPDGPVVVLCISGSRVYLSAPQGWMSPSDVAALTAEVQKICPTLARTCTPPLPPRETWPESWCEAWAERDAIAAEGGAPDPMGVADRDLRAMVARGELEPVPPTLICDSANGEPS